MPFEFNQVYLLTNPDKHFTKSAMVALGVRPVRDRSEHSDDWTDGWQFLVDNDAHGGHQILGEIVLDENGTVEVKDLDKKGEKGEDVIWRFEPLNLSMWHTYAKRSEVGGYDKLKDTMRHDNDVRNFYRELYLDPTVWTESQQ